MTLSHKSTTSSSWRPRNTFHIVQWVFALTLTGMLLFLFFKSSTHYSTRLISPCLAPHVQNSLRMSEEIYNQSKAKREEKVKSKPHEIDPWAPHTYPYDYFLASFGCPFSVQRLGKLGDGGKWACGIERYKTSPCIMYSFGIAGEASFEVEMLQKTSCEVFAFDASVNKAVGIPPEFQKRLNFSKIYAGSKTDAEHITLGAAMSRNGHTHIDIIKMDIEQSEFDVLDQIITEFGDNLPFSQLLIEIHVYMTDGSGFAKLYNFIEKLERAGLRAFRNELNIASFITSNSHVWALSEYSFLNIRRPCSN